MVGGRRQILLVAALIAGILSMHAVVAVDSMPGAHTAHTTPLSALAPGVSDHAGAADGQPEQTGAKRPAQPALAPPGVTIAGGGHETGHGSGLHEFLHLCVSILAALLLAAAVTVAVLYRLRSPDRRPARLGSLVRPVPARRPPPTSVRLAQLCVLRN